MISSEEVPEEARAAIRALIPSSAIDWVIRPRSRDPGSLYWRQTLVPEAAAQRLLGFAPPVLPSLCSDAVVEYLSLHGPSSMLEPEGAGLAAGDIRFRASYLPVGLPWLQATRASVSHGATLLTWSAEHAEHAEPDGDADGLRPQRLASSKADREREDAELERDFAVVEVGGAQLGVQVSESGLVCLMWRVRGGQTWCRASVMTRRDPVATVELMLQEGLLWAR